MKWPTFHEFFAGSGAVRLAIGDLMTCAFSNDWDPTKAAAYVANFGTEELRVADIEALTTADLPGAPALVWASPPCVDISLAGRQGGLNAARSGVFWAFAELMGGLVAQGRAPTVIAVENVTALLSSNGGADFVAIVEAFVGMGYAIGAVEIDAADFVPQSRRRVFIVAVRADADLPQQVTQDGPSQPYHTRAIIAAHERLAAPLRRVWRWWRLPLPPGREFALADVIQADVRGHPPDLARVLELMAPEHRAKLDVALQGRGEGEIVIGAINRRMRGGRQVAEIRLDGLANALRTASGGSSIQTLLVGDEIGVHARRITPREAARLMGIPDCYRLPSGVTAAHNLIGDGVCVPVVRWLYRHVLGPLLATEFLADLSRTPAGGLALSRASGARW